MKKYYLIFFIIFNTLIINTCEKSMIDLESQPFHGVWVEQGRDDNVLELKKTSQLDNQKYGFIIHPDGQFIEHTISGFCATPPVVYAEYEGTWELVSVDSIHINVEFWGGTRTYAIKVISTDNTSLCVKQFYW